jgi:nucleotide-binding universal stress UspA family protein
MTFSTLMVHLDLEQPNDARLRVAGDLAEKFNARLIGITAANPQPPYYAGGSVARGFVEHERAELKKRIEEAEARFRAAVGGRARQVEWRSAFERPNDFVAHEARATDLIIVGSNREGVLVDRLRQLDPSDLVMVAGRPLFLVPPEVEYLKLDNVLVAWKDTREARRAVVDALPLLHKAKDISVLEIVDGEANRDAAQARVNDVAAWLKRHDVLAFPKVLHATGEAEQIDRIWKTEADLVVAGAYGHARLREWVFGGVTRNLITRSQRCSFLAH